MKKYTNKLLYVFLSIAFLTACTEENIDTAAEIENTAGVTIDVAAQSSGEFLGSPEADVDLDKAEVNITSAALSLTITEEAGDLDQSDIVRLEVVKTIRNSEEIVVGETTTLPYTLTLDNIEKFLEGTELTAKDLRIGDALTLRVRAVKKSGEKYYYNNKMGRFALALNCAYDLSGTYKVTNSYCDSGSSGTIPLVKITQNSDGTWEAETADGGFLQYCTQNTGLQQVGSFAVGCGGVVDASNTEGGPSFCGSNGIGCILGGSWNQETGVLILENEDTYFGIGKYTSTYVRQ